MEQTLLEKAKKYGRKRVHISLTGEEKELVIAWLRGEVTISQMNWVLTGEKQNNTSRAVNLISYGVREMYLYGKLLIKNGDK